MGKEYEAVGEDSVDACEYSYGQVSYLRLVDNNDRIHCNLMIGKACVSPIKVMNIPRM